MSASSVEETRDALLKLASVRHPMHRDQVIEWTLKIEDALTAHEVAIRADERAKVTDMWLREPCAACAALVAERDALREALQPFAALVEMVNRLNVQGDSKPVWTLDEGVITQGHIRKAAALLTADSAAGSR